MKSIVFGFSLFFATISWGMQPDMQPGMNEILVKAMVAWYKLCCYKTADKDRCIDTFDDEFDKLDLRRQFQLSGLRLILSPRSKKSPQGEIIVQLKGRELE